MQRVERAQHRAYGVAQLALRRGHHLEAHRLNPQLNKSVAAWPLTHHLDRNGRRDALRSAEAGVDGIRRRAAHFANVIVAHLDEALKSRLLLV